MVLPVMGGPFWPVWINSALLCLVAPLDEYIKRDKSLRASMCEATARASGGREGKACLHDDHFCFVFFLTKMLHDLHLFQLRNLVDLKYSGCDPSIHLSSGPRALPTMSSAACHGRTAASMLAMPSDPSNPPGQLVPPPKIILIVRKGRRN